MGVRNFCLGIANEMGFKSTGEIKPGGDSVRSKAIAKIQRVRLLPHLFRDGISFQNLDAEG